MKYSPATSQRAEDGILGRPPHKLHQCAQLCTICRTRFCGYTVKLVQGYLVTHLVTCRAVKWLSRGAKGFEGFPGAFFFAPCSRRLAASATDDPASCGDPDGAVRVDDETAPNCSRRP